MFYVVFVVFLQFVIFLCSVMATKCICFKEIIDQVPDYLLLIIEKIEPYPEFNF